MSKLRFGITVFAVGLTIPASAQTRSSAKTIGLHAIVPASVRMIPGQPSANSAQAVVRSTADDRIEITVMMKGRHSLPFVRVPVQVTTNARSYLFRVSSLVEGASGTIWAEARASLASREHALNPNRVFALASNGKGASGEKDFIDLRLATPVDEEERQVRIEIQAVPQ